MLAKRWQPFAEMTREIDRLQAEMGALFHGQGAATTRPRGRGSFPALNVWDDENALFVEGELPGLELADIEIHVTRDNQLSIRGTRKAPDVEEGAWYRRERGFGEFARVVSLPYDVDPDAVSAELKLGILQIVLPKRAEIRPRRIEVKAG
ncbi:MAG: Hsp20/alpha crystallin family protein [Planctomycetes bacterium]|nr:Hsp20/alpha crystallin family protein [Planctomycetota bacterium]